jgi:hypothetical protein
MMNSQDYLLDLWYNLSGIEKKDVLIMPNIEELIRTEWSPVFEKLMRNRLLMCAFRYVRLHDVNKPKYNRVQKIKDKIEIYERTGNLECLVDIANIALMEFEEGEHPLKHFRSTDDKDHSEIIPDSLYTLTKEKHND